MPLTYQPFSDHPGINHLDETLPESDQSMQPWVNISRGERKWSLIGGAALVALGLLSRGSRRALGLLAGGSLLYRGTTQHCHWYEILGKSTADNDQQPAGVRDQAGHKVVRSIIIQRPRAELYSFWRNLENLPAVMSHVKSVEKLDEMRSRWTVSAPAGFSVQWDAEIINQRENELIAWQSLAGAQIPNAGSVWFQDWPGGGTHVKVALEYEPPAGEIGAQLASIFRESPEQQLEEDLLRFKEQMEAEVRSPK
jgi:uncharacterized membrane protein